MNETNNGGYVDYPLTKAEQTQFAEAKHAAQLTYEHLAITQATEDELMPNCPSCGEFKTVSKSVFPEEGTHYCHGALCDIYWFTPVNERPFAKAWREAAKKAFLSTPVRTIQDNGVTVRVEDDSRGIAAGIISEAAAFQREANRLKDEEFFAGDQWTAEQLQHMTERYVKPMLEAQLKAEAEGYIGQFDPLTDREISTLPWVKEGRFLYNAKCVNHEAHRTAVCDCPEPTRDRFTSVTSNALAADATLDSLGNIPGPPAPELDFVDCGKLTVNGPPVELSLQPRYRTLNHEFLRLMDEIGIYGEEKYGEESIATKFKRGDFTRSHRTSDDQITDHAYNHLAEFDEGKPHDHFGTRKHQLAASAFNAMMKYIFFINECRKEVA